MEGQRGNVCELLQANALCLVPLVPMQWEAGRQMFTGSGMIRLPCSECSSECYMKSRVLGPNVEDFLEEEMGRRLGHGPGKP